MVLYELCYHMIHIGNRRMFMFKNKPNEDEFDLSEMIDEYEEDNELRKKIEAMKQQAQRETLQEEDVVEASIESDSALISPQSLSNTRELPRYEDSVNANTFIDADDEAVEMTRVMSVEPDLDEADKTLVIMDNQKQRSFDTEEVASDDDSIYLYGNREVEEEEITEEDIEEFLGEEEPVKKAKKQMDPNKMNKMITYVITGIVAVCLVVGVGFGVKMLIDNSSTATTVDTDKDKDKDKDPETTKKPEEKPKDPSSETNKPIDNSENGNTTPDNSKRIAEINGMIKGYNAQIEQLKGYITTEEGKIAEAQEVLKSIDTAPSAYDETISSLSKSCDDATTSLSVAENDLKNAKREADENPDDQDKKDNLDATQKVYDKLSKEKTEYCNGLKAANDSKNQEKEKIKSEAENKKTTAESNKSDYLNQISDLQNQIQALQNERDTLQ